MSETPESVVRGVPGLHLNCRSTGACCRAGYTLGPVEPRVAAILDAAEVGAWCPPAAEGWSEDRMAPTGEPVRFLRQVNGACVFLGSDQLCAVHANLGAESKPAFCRLFPISAIRDPSGIVVGVRPNCHAQSIADSAPLDAERLTELAGLAQTAGLATFQPSAVRVYGGRAVSLDDWMYLEERVVDLSDGGPRFLLRAMRQTLVQAMPTGWPSLPTNGYDEAWRHVASDLLALLRPLSTGPALGPRQERVQAVVGLLDRALVAPREPVYDPAARSYLARQLRSAVMLKKFADVGTFAAGMGRFALGVEVVARAWPGEVVDCAALGPPWSMWHDIAVHPSVIGWFRAHGARLEAAFLAA